MHKEGKEKGNRENISERKSYFLKREKEDIFAEKKYYHDARFNTNSNKKGSGLKKTP